MFYLTYVMFLLVGHSGLSVVTGATTDSGATHGRRGGGSHGAGCY
jgi:hypothetical protein